MLSRAPAKVACPDSRSGARSCFPLSLDLDKPGEHGRNASALSCPRASCQAVPAHRLPAAGQRLTHGSGAGGGPQRQPLLQPAKQHKLVPPRCASARPCGRSPSPRSQVGHCHATAGTPRHEVARPPQRLFKQRSELLRHRGLHQDDLIRVLADPEAHALALGIEDGVVLASKNLKESIQC